jgi:prepilin-type N-terminal cleavage/methylation domain-containing protein
MIKRTDSILTDFPGRRRGAFTLLEIIVVTIILGVIAALAVPRMGQTMERMRAEHGRQVLLTLYGAQKRYWQENGHTYANGTDQLDIDLRPDPNFTFEVLNVNPIARANRDSGSWVGDYVLEISDAGTVTCTGSGCARLGF